MMDFISPKKIFAAHPVPAWVRVPAVGARTGRGCVYRPWGAVNYIILAML